MDQILKNLEGTELEGQKEEADKKSKEVKHPASLNDIGFEEDKLLQVQAQGKYDQQQN